MEKVPRIEITGTYLKHEDSILILKRHAQVPAGNLWCLPAGKLEKGESPLEGAIRETHEEAGILLESQQLISLGVYSLMRSDAHIIFHLFHAQLLLKPRLNLAPFEVQAAEWLPHEAILKLPLIQGGVEVLTYCKERLLL